jgi:hypothetical protein
MDRRSFLQGVGSALRDHGWYPEGQAAADKLLERVLGGYPGRQGCTARDGPYNIARPGLPPIPPAVATRNDR